MASGPISSWQRDGETMETVTDFFLLGFKITADCDCSHEIKRCLLLGRKESEVTQLCTTLCDSMDSSLPGSSIHGIFQARILEWVTISFSRRSSWPRDWTQVSRIVGRCFMVWATREVFWKKIYDKLRQCIKKQRHHFANKISYSQSYDLSCSHEQMWELDHEEDLALKNWYFWTWCWKRLLRVPWTVRSWNQSILKEMNIECSLEGLMLKLKLQNFGYLMQRADSLEKTLILERLGAIGEGGNRGWGGWMASLTQWVSLSKLGT